MKNIEIPKISMPPIYDPYRKNTIIIGGLLLIIIVLILIIFYKSDDPTHWKIVCSQNNNVVIKNNIQASHTWNMKPYILPENNEWGMYCFGIDDIGPLFGSSMQPTFFEGNTVILKSYNSSSIITLHTGDIVRFFRYNEEFPNCTTIINAKMNNSLGGSYVNNSMAVIHRINAIYDDVIFTQGDNLNELEKIDRCQITDVVLGVLFT